jgi:hypothetical protein
MKDGGAAPTPRLGSEAIVVSDDAVREAGGEGLVRR